MHIHKHNEVTGDDERSCVSHTEIGVCVCARVCSCVCPCPHLCVPILCSYTCVHVYSVLYVEHVLVYANFTWFTLI